MVIAGYHNFANNKGFVLNLPANFTAENYPNSAMTQVIGINNSLTTSGFYVDNGGTTHGFYHTSNGTYTTVDFAGTPFNQLLSQNDLQQAAGYYSLSADNTTPDFPYVYDEAGGVFEVITIPGAVGGAQATGINNSGVVCGFFIDSSQVNHGWLLNAGVFLQLDYPGSTFTQALGLNNRGQVVGTYMDACRPDPRLPVHGQQRSVRHRRRSQWRGRDHRQRHQRRRRDRRLLRHRPGQQRLRRYAAVIAAKPHHP